MIYQCIANELKMKCWKSVRWPKGRSHGHICVPHTVWSHLVPTRWADDAKIVSKTWRNNMWYSNKIRKILSNDMTLKLCWRDIKCCGIETMFKTHWNLMLSNQFWIDVGSCKWRNVYTGSEIFSWCWVLQAKSYMSPRTTKWKKWTIPDLHIPLDFSQIFA